MSKTDIMAREKIDRDRKTGDNMNGEERANNKLMAKYEPGNGKKDTRRLKDILRGSNYSGPVKILPNETFEEALERILEEQKKKGN
tara:strand:+ start:1575 stop:1832 length:258 start_codon:yes stop_codon:yes gene_type:complete